MPHLPHRLVQRHLLAVRKVDVSKTGLVILNNGIGALQCFVLILAYDPAQVRRVVD